MRFRTGRQSRPDREQGFLTVPAAGSTGRLENDGAERSIDGGGTESGFLVL